MFAPLIVTFEELPVVGPLCVKLRMLKGPPVNPLVLIVLLFACTLVPAPAPKVTPLPPVLVNVMLPLNVLKPV